MTQITKFDKQNLQVLRKELDLAMASVLSKYGIDGKLGNMSYSDYSFNSKITVNIESQEKANKEKEKAASLLNMFGLKIGDTFKQNNMEYTIVGYDVTKRSKPVMIEDSKKRPFYCSEEAAQTLIKRK